MEGHRRQGIEIVGKLRRSRLGSSGRYYRKTDKQKIAEVFHATKIDESPLPPWDYNVAPTSMQPSSARAAIPRNASCCEK